MLGVDVQYRELFRKLLIAGIAANVVVILVLILDQRHAYNVLSWEVYNSKTYGYSIDYPNGWFVEERKPSDVESETIFRRRGDTFLSATVFIQAAIRANQFRTKPERLSAPLLTVCHNAVLGHLKKRYRSFVELETSDIQLGSLDLEARVTNFEFGARSSLMTRRMAGRVLTTWNAGKPLSLIMVCPKVNYEEVSTMFDHFSQSFRPGRPMTGGGSTGEEVME